MVHRLTRREFLATAAAGLSTGWAHAAGFETELKKALIGRPSEKVFRRWREAGFAGMDTKEWNVSAADAAKARKTAEDLDMRIHGVRRGWVDLDSRDEGRVTKAMESIKTALRAAEGYGATTILLIPARVGGMPMPAAWEFDIEFDEKTARVTSVAPGDNAKYQKYIDAHNRATEKSREALAKLASTAEETGVTIALENVWNNLWVKPDLFRSFIDSVESPWVRAYYDIGNHVKYGKPERWIHTLGDRIVKVDVKDFQLNPNGQGGKFVPIRDGSVDWPTVRRALDDIGYSGWMTIEGSAGLSLKKRSRRLDRIIAGK